jgi:hypothetical protein
MKVQSILKNERNLPIQVDNILWMDVPWYQSSLYTIKHPTFFYRIRKHHYQGTSNDDITTFEK